MFMDKEDLLHGYCHRFVLDNYKKGDKVCLITDYDYDIDRECLCHACLIRNRRYLDVRGFMDTIDEVLEPFDYGEEMEVSEISFRDFVKYCKENDLI